MKRHCRYGKLKRPIGRRVCKSAPLRHKKATHTRRRKKPLRRGKRLTGAAKLRADARHAVRDAKATAYVARYIAAVAKRDAGLTEEERRAIYALGSFRR